MSTFSPTSELVSRELRALTIDSASSATAKLGNILFAKELQRRLDEEGTPILAMAIHPGEIATGTPSSRSYLCIQ